jgi:uncharacterized protein with HEPN domain
VSEPTRHAQAAIAWAEIRRMRSILAGACFGIDYDIVRQTVREDLPPLIVPLEQALGPTDAA